MFLRACLHKSGGHEVGEVSLIGVVTCLPICSLILLWSRLHDRWADPPHVTSPILGPPPPCKPALIFPKVIEPVQMMCWPPQSVLHMVGHELNNFIGTKESFYIGNRITPTGLVANIYTFTSLVCHGVGPGGSFTTCALEVEFCGFAAHLHALARPPVTPATAAQACEGLYFCGTT